MATIVSRALRVINRGRQKLVDVGLRPTRLYRRTKAWSSDLGELHIGRLRTTDVEIVPRPLIEGSDERLTATNITPPHTGGGWDPDFFLPDLEPGSETVYLVRQADDLLIAYRLAEVNKLDAFRFSLTLERIGRSKPDDYPVET